METVREDDSKTTKKPRGSPGWGQSQAAVALAVVAAPMAAPAQAAAVNSAASRWSGEPSFGGSALWKKPWHTEL